MIQHMQFDAIHPVVYGELHNKTLCIVSDTTVYLLLRSQTLRVSINPIAIRSLFIETPKTRGKNVNFCKISQMMKNTR